MERVAITDIPGLDPGSSFFVMSRFLHSEELIPVVATFSVSILKMPTKEVASRSKTKNVGDHHSFHTQVVDP